MSVTAPAALDAATGPHRGLLLLALAVLVAAMTAAAWLLIPWGSLTALVTDPGLDFTDAEQSRAEELRGRLRWWTVAATVLSLTVALLLGLSHAGSSLISSVPGGPLGQVLLGVPLLLAVGAVVTLPLSVRAEQLLRAAGLSTRDWAGFASDQAKGFALQVVLVTAGLGALFWLARRLPAGWPYAAAAAAALLTVLLSAGYPLLVEPLFNRFEPMPGSVQRDGLLALAERAGVPVSDVLVADASRRTTAHNAYVSGLGPTARLVVYDTLVADQPADQVEAVVAHELGHAARKDVAAGTVIGALGAAAVVLLVGVALTSPTLLTRAGASGAGDPRAAALILAVVAVVGVLATPWTNLASRQVEAAADRFALDLTGQPVTIARMQRELALANVADPDPPVWAQRWFATHPSTAQRLAMTRAWAADRGITVPPQVPQGPR